MSDAGNAQVAWRADGPVRLVIAAAEAEERTLYSGAAQSFFISGLEDGDYRLRLYGEAGQASEPLVLTVRHQSLTRALLLVSLGALVFLAIATVILRGARDD